MVTDEEILNYFVCKNRNAIISARINKSNVQKNTPKDTQNPQENKLINCAIATPLKIPM